MVHSSPNVLGAPPGKPASRVGTRFAFSACAVLLLGELLLLLGRFSAVDLENNPQPWLRLLAHANAAPQILLSMATALLLFGARGSNADVPDEPRRSRPPARIAAVLAAHLASFALLFHCSARIFQEQLAGSSYPALWLGAWVFAGAATVAFAALLALPRPHLLARLRRHASFVLGACLLGFAAWLAGSWAQDDLSRLLQPPTLWVAARVLDLFISDPVVDSANFVFGSASFRIRVAPECSGFEGIGLIAVFSVAYLGIFRNTLRFPRVLLLPILGIVLVWFINALRLSTFALLGIFGHDELAAGGFHSVVGTLSFCAVALGLVALSRRSGFFSNSEPEAEAEVLAGTSTDRTAAYLVPFLLGLALGMVVQGFEEHASLLEPLRTLVAGAALLLFRRQYLLQRSPSALAAILVGLFAAGAWLALAPSAGAAAELGDLRGGAWGWFSASLRLVGYLLVFPLAEELAFRGYLMRRLTSVDWQRVEPKDIPPAAWIVSAAIFGLLHEHWLGGIAAGLLYGVLYVRSGSLFAAALAHGLTNAALAAYELLASAPAPA